MDLHESSSVLHKGFCFRDVVCPAHAEPQCLQLSSVCTSVNRWVSIHMATDRPLPALLLFSNEWRSSLICCLDHSGSISLCSNSCMKFRRGHLGCNTAGAAMLLMPFSGLKEKGAHIFSSPTVLTVKPQGRGRNTVQIKSLEPRACTVSSSLFGH